MEKTITPIEPKTIADDVLDAVKQAEKEAEARTGVVVIPASTIASPENKKLVAAIEKEIELTPNEYMAFAMLRKKGTGGLWIMRKMKIKDGQIVDMADSVENIAGVLLGEITYELEKEI